MNAQTKVRAAKPVGEYVNYYASYLQERAHSKKLERLLSRSLTLLDMETHRRELAGEDVAHLRAFISEARSV